MEFSAERVAAGGYGPLIAAVWGNPVAMLNLARTLLIPAGEHEIALQVCEEARRQGGVDSEADTLGREIRTRGVGSWYFTMVQDRQRHGLYADAFRRLFRPGCTVLDIGAGTGLFAMMAARAGASRVYGCECNPSVALAARQVVAANRYNDRVTILTRSSMELEVGRDLDAPVDVILWDNLANNLYGVGAARTLADARERLAREDAIVIPGRIEMLVGLVDTLFDDDQLMADVDGFDLSPFNACRPTDVTSPLRKWQWRSEGRAVFDANCTQDLFPERNSVSVTSTGGRVTAIAQWLRFHLAPGIIYETRDPGVTAFGVQFHAVEPRETEAGEAILIAGAHDLNRVWFWLEKSGV